MGGPRRHGPGGSQRQWLESAGTPAVFGSGNSQP
ncbi:hypothetical protein DUNSADRAFT_3962 [Dunaliella salina]|uniref:Uncharacterized protein n=1 Tax=Dunaliella salina TaxID=3046 RepID=A0ABQ7H7V9_DUNSA|nr:hypothetical protein DUNSADRAFT_3962 [Dunaliella salina]|eukprot:KAF5842935.1 hypothetical protein DUNSADRAFT_3962 [Dunaliella salina]